jgi:hypothetical protein
VNSNTQRFFVGGAKSQLYGDLTNLVRVRPSPSPRKTRHCLKLEFFGSNHNPMFPLIWGGKTLIRGGKTMSNESKESVEGRVGDAADTIWFGL